MNHDLWRSVKAPNLQATLVLLPAYLTAALSSHTVQLASSRLPGGIDINLDLNFITPSAFKLHFRPCFFDINLEYELAHFADADCVNWQDFALNRDHQAIFERYLWECANVES